MSDISIKLQYFIKHSPDPFYIFKRCTEKKTEDEIKYEMKKNNISKVKKYKKMMMKKYTGKDDCGY